MSVSLTAEPPPLTVDEHGRIRVAGTRVLLELVVGDFRRGLSAEQIAERYDALDLADIYGALRYYLTHRAEVDAYIARREADAAALKDRITAAQRPFPSRDELLARRTFHTGERVPASGIWRRGGGPAAEVALAAGDTFPPASDGRTAAEWGYVARHMGSQTVAAIEVPSDNGEEAMASPRGHDVAGSREPPLFPQVLEPVQELTLREVVAESLSSFSQEPRSEVGILHDVLSRAVEPDDHASIDRD